MERSICFDKVILMFSLSIIATPSIGKDISERNFDEDVEFLKSHVRTIILGNQTNSAQLAVVPAYQGRVMTSTVKVSLPTA